MQLVRHHEPRDLSDRVALFTVKILCARSSTASSASATATAPSCWRPWPPCPAWSAALLQHLKCLRRIEDDKGWIRTLLDEAENERMHLMTFIHVAQPARWERWLILLAQGAFYNAFFLLYLVSPRTAHRVVGYLEEEAVVSYSQYLEEIDAGRLENPPAPEIAIDYWKLPADASLRDVVLAVRDDEAGHRDVNA